MPNPTDGPHSRACGPAPHAHGTACSATCPTCGENAKPIEHTLPEGYHPSMYDYEHITRERYDEIIDDRYRNLHNKLMMNDFSQGFSPVSPLLDQIRALEAVRDHLFPEPTKSSLVELMAVTRMQHAKFGKMSSHELNANHDPKPPRRRESAFYAKCEVCNQMCQQLNDSWTHAPKVG